jgi:hypothetical protein
MTPAKYIHNYHELANERNVLPEASADEHMYFATAEDIPPETEKTYIHQQNLMLSTRPKSTL